eukprot:scaffold301_cov393-Prasinococcus_capsulatus_cf.AAC.20
MEKELWVYRLEIAIGYVAGRLDLALTVVLYREDTCLRMPVALSQAVTTRGIRASKMGQCVPTSVKRVPVSRCDIVHATIVILLLLHGPSV